MSKSYYIILTITFLISFPYTISCARDPVVCKKPCPEGFHVNEDCSCTEGKFCIQVVCDPLGYIRDYRNCGCIPPEELLPYKPIVCPNANCPRGVKILPNCKCDFPFPPDFPDKPIPLPILPPIMNECPIEKCDERFQLDYRKCDCVPWKGGICKIGCLGGRRVYAMPGIINCKCTFPPKCRIKSCKNNAKLVNCKCVKKSNQCDIRKYKKMFEIDYNRYICKLEYKPIFKRKFKKGRMMKPGTYKYKRRSKCPIGSCKKGYRLKKRRSRKCRCVKRRGFGDFDF